MIICAKCRKEMQCTKNGRPAIYGVGHVYMGDEYSCVGCDAVILNCGNSHHMDKAIEYYKDERPVLMEER